MKKWISTPVGTSDRSGFVEYGLIAAILVTTLAGAVTAKGDDRAAIVAPCATKAADVVRRQGPLLTGHGFSFPTTSGEHRD